MKIYIWNNILNKLHDNGIKSYEIDIRYLNRWIKLFPNCFPKCVLNGNYTPVFNSEKYRWEIWYGIHKIEFDPQNYI